MRSTGNARRAQTRCTANEGWRNRRHGGEAGGMRAETRDAHEGAVCTEAQQPNCARGAARENARLKADRGWLCYW